MGKKVDLTGKKFGRWTVIGEGGRSKHRRILWKCVCECGTEREVVGESLVNGVSKSCGCYNVEQIIDRSTTHGCTNERLYIIWKNMKSRCYNKNNNAYEYYGGRGIVACDEWKDSFANFREWAISHGYTDELTIDRIDVNGNYEPSNCRWSTMKEQANNTRRTKYVNYNGKTYSATEFSRITGVKYGKILYILNRGYKMEDALFKERLKDITYNGETHSMKYWADKTGIAQSTLHRRIHAGWLIEDALTKHSKTKHEKKLT